jgi:hypothetical protein
LIQKQGLAGLLLPFVCVILWVCTSTLALAEQLELVDFAVAHRIPVEFTALAGRDLAEWVRSERAMVAVQTQIVG